MSRGTFAPLRETRACLLWLPYPGLLDQKRQVVHPILLTYSARIDDVREIIFAVGENEISVCHSVVPVGRSRLCGYGNARGPLDRLDCPFRPSEPDKTPVEQIQPASQH